MSDKAILLDIEQGGKKRRLGRYLEHVAFFPIQDSHEA